VVTAREKIRRRGPLRRRASPSPGVSEHLPKKRPGTGRLAYLLNAPAILVILGLIAYPIVYSLWISLHNDNVNDPGVFTFAGVQNYLEALRSDVFRSSLVVTAEFAAGAVAVVVLFGLALALLLDRDIPGRGVLRALMLVPWAVPPIINAALWRLIFDAHTGALNGLLSQLGIISHYQSWLVQPKLALVMVVIAYSWNRVPLAAIVLLAGLQAIPRDLYEAARIDRANAWQRFRRITLPYLARPLVIVLIIETMTSLRAFDLFYVLTSGGPGTSTTVLSWLTYQTAFVNLDLGLGAAYSYILVAITVIVAIFYIRALSKGSEVES
jgi:multiple sugar transport system permease protein